MGSQQSRISGTILTKSKTDREFVNDSYSSLCQSDTSNSDEIVPSRFLIKITPKSATISTDSGFESQQSISSLQSTRMSTASLFRNFYEIPPIYQSTSGDYYVAFDSSKYALSNGFICPNKVHTDGHCFASSEHCYLFYKALFHERPQIADKILVEDDVQEVRRLVKPLEKMNHKKWRTVQLAIMRKACMAKFGQNPSLRRELFRTGHATLIAAIPDCRWGVGRSIDDPKLTDASEWRGFNLLGQVLMSVRTLLASQYIDDFQNEQVNAEKRQKKAIKVN